ncbi:MAG: sulfoxide reductase heme-binding subunit YedZ [Nevskia sp.]|nr:sulfoxide reductase heme-binding subunit YedZ [Nevskia sp.]
MNVMPKMTRLLWLKTSIWLLCLAPLALLAWQAWTAHLGPDPVATLEHRTGVRALQLLLLTLAMTPLRQFSGRPEPLQLRRTLGLFAYFYMCLHFTMYLVFDLELSLPKLGEDLVKRTWITLGFACWLFLLPLAITSTNGWQRRLKRAWKSLHRLIYPAALLACCHFIWLVKKDETEPLLYLSILMVLLAVRLPWRSWARGIIGSQTTT